MEKTMYEDLLLQYGSPLYVYDASTLRGRCSTLWNFKTQLESSTGKKVRMHYSTKSNNNPAILKFVKHHNLSVDCMSPLELAINERCGFAPEDIIYVCNNIERTEMMFVHNKNILGGNGIIICLDSISQVDTWGALFPDSDIMVRINPGTAGVGHSDKVKTSGKATKFGISEENIPALLNVAKYHGLNILGTHQHLGSLFLNDKVPDYIAGIKAGLDIVSKYFKEVKIVDLGGGFGVPYKPCEEPLDFDYLLNELVPVLKNFIAEHPSVEEFKFEPGRYIPCEAGSLVGRVTAIKHENDICWICTDIGMNELVRPSMYDSYHEITVFTDNTETGLANFCGNVCESGDILGKNRMVPIPNVGDIVVVHNAGAYGYSMASNYTGRPRPAEVLVDGEPRLIRKRESIYDMMHNIVWL